MNHTNKNTNLATIAIVGAPNAGKSSLFNRLVRRRKSIVEATPGITRNRLEAIISIDDNVQVRLIDTGGITVNSKEKIDELVYKQVDLSIKEADAILFICDARLGPTSVDYHAASLLRKSAKKVFLLANKIDDKKMDHLIYDLYQLGMGQPYPVSAASNYGVKAFLKELGKYLAQERKASPLKLKEKASQKEKVIVTIAGRPNVGKSSFVNALLKEDIFLVEDKGGTTRDSADIDFEYKDKTFALVDTAGMKHKRKLKETVEIFSIARSKDSIRKAEVVLVMLDARDGLCVDDIKIIEYVEEYGKPCAILVNKWDLMKGINRQDYEKEIKDRVRFLEWMPIIFTSCVTKSNIFDALELAATLKERANKTIQTPELNKLLEQLQHAHKHPMSKGRNINIFYATQTQGSPQTFIIFSNYPKLIMPSYLSFLEKNIRSYFDLLGVPIRFKLRQR